MPLRSPVSLDAVWKSTAGDFVRRLARFVTAEAVYARLAAAILLALVAAASVSGFYQKWNFRDGAPRLSVALVLDGEGVRPVAYRQLIPMIANAINELTPTPWRDGFAAFVKADDGRHRFGLGGPQASMPEYALRYHIVYWLTFLSWAAALGLLAYTATHMTSPVSAVVGIATFGLLFPLLQTRGGYFYDYPEMFFFAAAVAIASSSRPYLLILLAPIATLNKETFLVFAPALFPFLAINGRNRAGLILGATLLASGLAYLWIRFTTASLPGEVAQFWLFQQPWFYLNPMNLFRGDATYGIPHPEISYLVFFIPVWLLVRSGWGRLTPAFQQHALIALAINLPLFIVFCYPGEIRNLSLMWVTLAMLIAIAADTAIRTRSISGVG